MGATATIIYLSCLFMPHSGEGDVFSNLNFQAGYTNSETASRHLPPDRAGPCRLHQLMAGISLSVTDRPAAMVTVGPDRTTQIGCVESDAVSLLGRLKGNTDLQTYPPRDDDPNTGDGAFLP